MSETWQQGFATLHHVRTDTVTPTLIERFRAMLDGMLGPGEVPPGLHWCLAGDAIGAAHLGEDGHPLPGILLPDTGLPRRMWAGGELNFGKPMSVGDQIERRTEVSPPVFKTGRSGKLAFVKVHHAYAAGSDLLLTERHDIVYRAADNIRSDAQSVPAEAWPVAMAWELVPNSTLLFRYSALTFNGHRIHYDQHYATQAEGYEGLVVHGPLQATLMLNLATTMMGKLPSRFTYRALTPLICDVPITIEAMTRENELFLRVRTLATNMVTMQATAL